MKQLLRRLGIAVVGIAGMALIGVPAASSSAATHAASSSAATNSCTPVAGKARYKAHHNWYNQKTYFYVCAGTSHTWQPVSLHWGRHNVGHFGHVGKKIVFRAATGAKVYHGTLTYGSADYEHYTKPWKGQPRPSTFVDEPAWVSTLYIARQH